MVLHFMSYILKWDQNCRPQENIQLYTYIPDVCSGAVYPVERETLGTILQNVALGNEARN